MAHYFSEFEAPNTPAEAFAYVSEFQNAAEWDPAVQGADKVDVGPTRVGTRFVLRAKLLGDMPYQVVEYEPNKRLVVEGQNRLFCWRDEIGFHSCASGTRISYDAVMDLRGLFGVGQPWFLAPFLVAGRFATNGIRNRLTLQHATKPRPRSRATPDKDAPIVTPQDVARIAAMDDQPALRNLLITLGYHDISSNLARFLGTPNINWCTMGAWASNTAGVFIRKEEVPKQFRELLSTSGRVRARHATLVGALLGVDPSHDHKHTYDPINIADEIIEHVSKYIVMGNKVVFAELAGAFTGFLQAVGDRTERDDEALEAFLKTMPDGPSIGDKVVDEDGKLIPTSRGGQTLLKKSIRTYYAAKFEKDSKKHAELILLANGYGGLHEQTRLQPYIAGSLSAPIDEIAARSHDLSLTELIPDGELLKEVRGAAHAVMSPVNNAIKEVWNELSTETLMTLKLPDGMLYLGRALPAAPGDPLFPRDLEKLSNSTLVEILAQYDAYDVDSSLFTEATSQITDLIQSGLELAGLPRRALGTGASNWVELNDRMRYIFTLFRSRQQDGDLFRSPFTKEQTKALREGRIPDGPLY